MPETSTHPNTPRDPLEHSLLLYSPVHNPAPDTAGRVGVQPAAEFGHVKRYRHVRHVLGAPRVHHAPDPQLGLSPAYHFAPPSLRRHLARRASPRFVCSFSDWTGSVGVQPAAESRHIQRHRHGRHAVGAHARPAPSWATFTACRLCRRRSAAPCTSWRASPRLVCPPFDTAGRVGVQPAAESRHIQRHRHALDVLGAHLHTPPVSLHARTSPRSICPSFELAGLVGVQPAAESRHVQRHRHERHVFGALAQRVSCDQCPVDPSPCTPRS